MASASLRISTFCFALVISTGLLLARAEEETTEGLPSLDEAPVEVQMEEPPPPMDPGSDVTEVPTGEIEAKVYDLTTIRPSKSGRVYLFQKADAEMPQVGKVFLLREGTTPVMAFRVLKTYPAQMRIAAKKLRAYPTYDPLARGSSFRAFEKIGDVMVPVPPTQEDLDDLKELEDLPPPPEEPEVLPAEEEETAVEETPEPEASEEQAGPEDPRSLYEEEEDLEIREEDEDDEFDSYYPNQFSMDVGLFPSSNIPGPGTKFGGGLRYGRRLSARWLIEGGVFYYRSSDADVSLTILPMIGTLQWLSRFNSIMTGYLYGGLIYPYVGSNVGASNRQLAEIQTVSLAAGAGIYLQTGPNWYLRANLGFEAMTLGVMLRF